MVTPPGAHSGVPAGQAHPTRRTRRTQHPHGASCHTTSAHARREAERSPPARPCQFRVPSSGDRRGGTHTHTHTHTHTFVAARYIAVLPISRDDHGGPAETDHRFWEPPRDSPVPPQGATNRSPAPEVDYATQPSSLPGQLVTPPEAHPGVTARQAHPTRRPRRTQHPHGSRQVATVQARLNLGNSGFSPDETGGVEHTHTHTCCYRGTKGRLRQKRHASITPPAPSRAEGVGSLGPPT